MPAVVVPSDITLLEEKHNIGRRSLSWMEKFGLLGIPPMLHISYSKMDRGDMRAVLSRKFDPSSANPVVDICRRRQESVSKYVVSHNGLWGGAGVFGGLTFWSVRRYNYQSKLIMLPFMAYGGAILGRVVGDILSTRNSEFARDAFLGSLPAKTYFNAEK